MKRLKTETVGSILRSMPEVQEGAMHGSRAFKVRGKLLACPAIHASAEPDSWVVAMPADERDRLVAEQPNACYVTAHYAKNAVVLVRLAEFDRKALRSLLERAYRWLNRA